MTTTTTMMTLPPLYNFHSEDVQWVDVWDLNVLDMEISKGVLKRKDEQDKQGRWLWDEYNKDGTRTYTFNEESRDKVEVMLWDQSRKIGLRIRWNFLEEEVGLTVPTIEYQMGRKDTRKIKHFN